MVVVVVVVNDHTSEHHTTLSKYGKENVQKEIKRKKCRQLQVQLITTAIQRAECRVNGSGA